MQPSLPTPPHPIASAEPRHTPRLQRARTAGRSLLLATLGLFAAAGARAQTPPPIFQTWLTNLSAAGYGVTQGSAVDFNLTYCKKHVGKIFRSCLGTSQNDPYIVVQPPVGGEFSDPYYASAGSGTSAAGIPSNMFYQLSSGEALITIVNLPPMAAYFSLQSYLLTRPIADYPNWKQKASPDPSRALIFGSFNNSTNNIDILANSGLTFGQGTVAIITTANQALAQALTSQFTAIGAAGNLIYADPMPPSLNIGLGAAQDDFMTVLRLSGAMDKSQTTAWQNDAATNVMVYRIEAPVSVGATLYGSQTLLTKNYFVDESSHASNLAELQTLLANWLAGQEPRIPVTTVATSSERVNKKGVIFGGLAGPFCVSAGTFCTGDEQDTDAYKIAAIGPLTGTNIAMMVGVDHTATNNATYISAAVEDEANSVRVTNSGQTNAAAAGFSSGHISGSASQMLMDLGLYNQASPQLIADLPNLYAQMFTRSCASGAIWCGATYMNIIPPSPGKITDKLDIVERAYVLPGASNGANPDYLLNPEIIH